MTELAAWFVQQSIFTEDKAIAITCRLQKEFWIDSLMLLRDGLKHDPELLSVLDIPKHLQLNIMSKLSSAIDPVKPLDTLGVNEVKALMASIFPDEADYVRSIGENRINGFVLTSIDCKSRQQSLSKLKDYGISSEIHADVLRTHLSQWVQSGVPIRYLSDSNRNRSPTVAIKPEQCNSSGSGSAMPTNHTKSRDNHSDEDRHSDEPVVSNPIQAAVSHHEEGTSVRSDTPLAAAVAHLDDSIELMDFDGTSFHSTISLVFKPSKHPNAALPINDSGWTAGEQADASVGSKGYNDSRVEASTCKIEGNDSRVEASTSKIGDNSRCGEASISKRMKDCLLPALDRVINKRHKPQIQLADTGAAVRRLSNRSSTTVHLSKSIADTLLTDDPSKGLYLQAKSRPPTNRVLVTSSNEAPASSGDRAVAASSSSSSPSDVLYSDYTKLQALNRKLARKAPKSQKLAFIKHLVADGYLKIAIALIGDKDNAQHHNVTNMALVLLNLCVCAGDSAVLRHIISEGGLTKALTHCLSNDYECRNQSLWVVGNISTDDRETKSRIPCGLEQRARIVAESYKSISRFTPKQQFVLRNRYAETFYQVSSETVPESFPSLRVFLEPLMNIISLSDHPETADFACQALKSLVGGTNDTIVDALIDQHVVERLREKLDHLTTAAAARKPNPAMLDVIFGTLDAMARCSHKLFENM